MNHTSSFADDATEKIEDTFHNHQTRLRLKNRTTWKIYEKLAYSNEQIEEKLRDIFNKLLEVSDILSLSITKFLEETDLSVEEKRLLRLSNPDNIQIESNYQGPHIKYLITRSTFLDLIKAFQKGQILHEKYVCIIVHQARTLLKTLPNVNYIDLSNLHHIYIIGDLHGQLNDLLYIFNMNGLPGINNPYIFNGDFVDRGSNSVEVILLLLVALIIYPNTVFLNRGNHEDYLITQRYGFENEINQKYPKSKRLLVDLFKDLFCWLPIYSSVDTGNSKLMIVHGGISDRIHLSQINSLSRNRYISLSIPPISNKPLTKDEQDEYLQITDLLWCDPDPEDYRGCRKNIKRKMACYFGQDITEEFLNKNHFSMIIRSHEVKQKGYEFEHNKKILTIFSASNYNEESNSAAFGRLDYKIDDPWIMSYTYKDIPSIEEFTFNKQVTLFEDPIYQSIMEKIMIKKSLFQNEFDKLDKNQTNHIPSIIWADIMKNILQIDLPWFSLRSKFVKEDTQGILYNTMFEEYHLDNIIFQKSHTGIIEDIYTSKDILMALFNRINSDHSGFINRNQFSNIIKLLFDNEDDIDEIISAMDFNKNGKIDLNEFLETFRIVNMNQPRSLLDKQEKNI